MNVNISTEDSSINDFLTIFDTLKKRPHKFLVHDVFFTTQFIDAIKNYKIIDTNYITELITGKESTLNRKVFYQFEDNFWISFLEIDVDSEDSTISEVCFYYEDTKFESNIWKILDNLSSLSLIENIQDFKTGYISQTSGQVEVINLDLNGISIDSYHNKNVVKKLNGIVKKINKTERGLTIFSGERGLGKTTAAKYIAQQIQRNTVFVPGNLIDHTINNPEFKNLLSPNKKYLIIIDDCELLYTFGKNNFFTSNILQMVDGFLADNLNLQIMLIYNQEVDDIDENILHANNLLDVVEFEYLDVKTANNLLEELDLKQNVKDCIRLIEVFKTSTYAKNSKIGLE